jgi:hypothetical protein
MGLLFQTPPLRVYSAKLTHLRIGVEEVSAPLVLIIRPCNYSQPFCLPLDSPAGYLCTHPVERLYMRLLRAAV